MQKVKIVALFEDEEHVIGIFSRAKLESVYTYIYDGLADSASELEDPSSLY